MERSGTETWKMVGGKLGYEGIVHDSAADMTLPQDPATRNVLIAVRESNPGCRLQIVLSR